jgi:two-component system NarL family sensor kinase
MEGSCYCLQTYGEGDLEGAANVNVVTCSRLAALVDGTDGLRYHASIPLYAPGDVRLGVLNVASADWRGLSEDDLRILYTVGDLLSIAVERARLFQQSAEMGATEERNRLARELHDTLAQDLAAITLQLEAAEAHLGDDADHLPVRDAVGRALALAQNTLQEARRSVLDLRAAPLEGRTLSEAVAGLVGGLRGAAGIQADFESVGGARPVPARIESGMYRIAQEAITNVVRHSGASMLAVRLAATPAEIELSVDDNGRGFEQSTVPEGRYGLVGINERARLLGGSMRLESSLGLGTRIEVRVPLDSTSAKESAL